MRELPWPVVRSLAEVLPRAPLVRPGSYAHVGTLRARLCIEPPPALPDPVFEALPEGPDHLHAVGRLAILACIALACAMIGMFFLAT